MKPAPRDVTPIGDTEAWLISQGLVRSAYLRAVVKSLSQHRASIDPINVAIYRVEAREKA